MCTCWCKTNELCSFWAWPKGSQGLGGLFCCSGIRKLTVINCQWELNWVLREAWLCTSRASWQYFPAHGYLSSFGSLKGPCSLSEKQWMVWLLVLWGCHTHIYTRMRTCSCTHMHMTQNICVCVHSTFFTVFFSKLRRPLIFFVSQKH